jgi:uncharacterized protein YjbI with pentapeptide repeats
MDFPAWLGLGERRWKKSPDEEVQPSKTVWDFLQLLIVPIMLVAIALAFNAAQSSREQRHSDAQIRADRTSAEAAREDATLDAYFGRMSDLMLDKRLLSSKPGSAVRQVARTETLASLRRLNGARKAQVVQFLFEAGLIQIRFRPSVRPVLGQISDWTIPRVSLEGADLRGADFRGATFFGTDVHHKVRLNGDLRAAHFDGAWISLVTFAGANLEGATFDRASIDQTSFEHSHLANASFRGSDLEDLDFFRANLAGTRFDHASFGIAVQRGENWFTGSCLSNASFASATFTSDSTTDFAGARGHDLDFTNAHVRGRVILDRKLKALKLDGMTGHLRRATKTDDAYWGNTC